ncbi:MAG: hypothetical protein JNM67_09045, partial [Bacteroidetes bacterium]|nr:hypothetical protein [Bacteroidota bacterium]
AINKIDIEGVPSDAQSKYYDVIFNEKKYPPKLIVSFANIYANGEELNRNNFSGGEGTPCFNLLSKNGFIIEKKNNNDHEFKIWVEKTIVNNRQDRIAGDRALGVALWSPQRSSSGADIYRNMRLVNENDIIIHLIDNNIIIGVSRVQAKATEAEGLEGTDWNVPSYLIKLKNYIKLETPLKRDEFLNIQNQQLLLKIAENSEVFYTNQLGLRQGAYLTPCPKELFYLLSKTYKKNYSLDFPYSDKLDFSVSSNQVEEPLTMKYLTYYNSIKTKPFIILAGLSGTGKSRIARTLAYQFNNLENDRITNRKLPTNFNLVKVKPNWHDSSDLLGYESRISGKDRLITTDFIRFIVKAWQHINTPFFLCLDEMNLAPVEQYFAEYLSAIETRKHINGKIRTDALLSSTLINKYSNKENGVDPSYDLWNELDLHDIEIQNFFKENGIELPPNLIVIGTVNMDETTHSFSRKVLDRSMTIEMNDINLSHGLDNSNDDWSYPNTPSNPKLVLSEKTEGAEVFSELGPNGPIVLNYLNNINSKLEGSPFKIAYRVRDEFLIYVYNYSLIENKPEDWIYQALDDMTLMKILPRIEGDEEKTQLLDDLVDVLTEMNLQKSLSKATEMTNRRKLYHYTSFWL